MTLIQLLEQARELAYWKHYVDGDYFHLIEDCPGDKECTCWAKQHNEKVDEVFEQLNIILLESYND